ncbi:hypothetical protein IID22_05340 [Patescibacteria group bacterium]|nr:hypothetical protein [Patescibacteria group bacterium]
MGEIHLAFRFPEGDPVKGGKIPIDLSPDAISAVINAGPQFRTTLEFENYFQLRLAEHGLEYEDEKSGLSAQEEEGLEAIQHSIVIYEAEHPSFQKEFTDYLNSALNKHR